MKRLPDYSVHEPELMRCVTLSLSHLTEMAREWLESVEEEGAEGVVVYAKQDFWQDLGFFVYLYPELCFTGSKDLMPESFRDCFDYAVSYHCGMIIFDRDGPCMADLKRYSGEKER